MLENVNVNSIKIDDRMGAFVNSELQSIEKEMILTHFVRLSQERGEWVIEISFNDFVANFIGLSYFRETEVFCSYFFALEKDGYLTIESKEESGNDILRVTEKFAELCEKYAA